jgi:phage I-like protein
MSKEIKNLSRCVDLSELKFGEGATREIQILPVGEWNHPSYGKIVITAEDIKEYVKNFNDDVRKGVPIDIEHKTMDGAVGWISSLINKGKDGAWALIDWTKDGIEKIKNKEYRFFSPEFATEYTDPETGKKYKNVLMGGALTNRPYFKELKTIELSEKIATKKFDFGIPNETPAQTRKMDKCVNALLADEKFVPEDKSQDKKSAAIAVCKVRLGFTKKANEDNKLNNKIMPEDKKNNEEPKEEPKNEEPKEEPKKEEPKKEEPKEAEPVEANEKTVKINASEHKTLTEKAEKLEKMEVKKETTKYLFSENNDHGRFLPKSEDSLTDFVMSLSEDLRKKFYSLVEEMPKAKYFEEIGSDKDDDTSDTKKDKDVDEASHKLNELGNKIFEESKKNKTGLTLEDSMLQAEQELESK